MPFYFHVAFNHFWMKMNRNWLNMSNNHRMKHIRNYLWINMFIFWSFSNFLTLILKTKVGGLWEALEFIVTEIVATNLPQCNESNIVDHLGSALGGSSTFTTQWLVSQLRDWKWSAVMLHESDFGSVWYCTKPWCLIQWSNALIIHQQCNASRTWLELAIKQ